MSGQKVGFRVHPDGAQVFLLSRVLLPTFRAPKCTHSRKHKGFYAMNIETCLFPVFFAPQPGKTEVLLGTSNMAQLEDDLRRSACEPRAPTAAHKWVEEEVEHQQKQHQRSGGNGGSSGCALFARCRVLVCWEFAGLGQSAIKKVSKDCEHYALSLFRP